MCTEYDDKIRYSPTAWKHPVEDENVFKVHRFQHAHRIFLHHGSPHNKHTHLHLIHQHKHHTTIHLHTTHTPHCTPGCWRCAVPFPPHLIKHADTPWEDTPQGVYPRALGENISGHGASTRPDNKLYDHQSYQHLTPPVCDTHGLSS